MPQRQLTFSLFVGIVVLCLLTGGLAVARSYGPGAQNDMNVGEGVHFDAWFLPHRTAFRIPFVFSYTSEGPAFSLRVGVQTWPAHATDYLSIHIADAVVEYSDGQRLRREIAQSYGLRGVPRFDSRLGLRTGCVEERADCYIDVRDLVLRPVPAKVTLNGWFTGQQNERVEFSMPIVFNPKASFILAPYVWMLLQSGM